jgi:hypothetical protein
MLLIKSNLHRIPARMRKRAFQPSRGRQDLIVDLEAGRRGQVREENGFVGHLVYHTNVAGTGPGTMTRKHQEQAKSRGLKRKCWCHDTLTNPSQVVHPCFRGAFLDPVTNRREPHAGSQHCRSHNTPGFTKVNAFHPIKLMVVLQQPRGLPRSRLQMRSHDRNSLRQRLTVIDWALARSEQIERIG